MLPISFRHIIYGYVCPILAGLYLFVAFVVCMPDQFPLRGPINAASEAYFRFSGLWQGWAMFAPNPISEDIYVSALGKAADGTEIHWEISRMNHFDLVKRYKMERWRKWANDNLRLDSNKALWPTAAEWLAHEMERETSKKISSIELIRHWQPAVVPDQSGSVGARPGWNHFRFYSTNLAH